MDFNHKEHREHKEWKMYNGMMVDELLITWHFVLFVFFVVN